MGTMLPSLDNVYQAIYEFNSNPNPIENKKASLWLEELQNSVFAWKVADDMLHLKKDMVSCYFAAQTMRIKIQKCFHELPATSYESLRDSLLQHISQIDQNTNNIIVTQLCLALADLILQMVTWQDPITDLLEKFAFNEASLWPLLEILTVLPEELNSRFLRLGENRREQIICNLNMNAERVLEFLNARLKNHEDETTNAKILKCFTSWIAIHAIPVYTDPEKLQHKKHQELFSNLITQAFLALQNNNVGSTLHEVASDCISNILQVLEDTVMKINMDLNNSSTKDDKRHEELLRATKELQTLQYNLFAHIMELNKAYHISVAHEDVDKSVNYCRIFTELAENYLETIVFGTHCGGNQHSHYAIKSLDYALMCVGHHDYEVAQITFNLWYRLSEILYHKNDDEVTNAFKPYVERLICALCRHCQMEPDHLGLIDEGDAFADFRERVLELIKDVVFVIGSCHCFRQMFERLTSENNVVTWDMTEAALFVMYAVAKNILPAENDVVPKVVEAILNLPENTHIAVRFTSLLLLGELCEWIYSHPETLNPILNYLLANLRQAELGRAASNALQSIWTSCSRHMTLHMQEILHIAKSFDDFAIDNEASISLLKGICNIISLLPSSEVEFYMKELCKIQETPLNILLETRPPVERGTSTDPTLWVDRLAIIFKTVSPNIDNPENPHPCYPAAKEMWPVLSSTLTTHQQNPRIMERCVRCLRFMIRSLREGCVEIIIPLAEQIVQLYAVHHHSSFLYLGSILVDIFGIDDNYITGLLQMLQAFIVPTFTILQEPDGMKNHPDTLDDFYRLCDRFLRTSTIQFLSSDMIGSIFDCALTACSVDHREANASVMKFFGDFLHVGRSSEKRPDFEIRKNLVQKILNEKGQILVSRIIYSAVYDLPSYMLTDVAEVIVELNTFNKKHLAIYLEQALGQMPKETLTGTPTASLEQLQDFHRRIMRTDNPREIVRILRDFSRLYR